MNTARRLTLLVLLVALAATAGAQVAPGGRTSPVEQDSTATSEPTLQERLDAIDALMAAKRDSLLELGIPEVVIEQELELRRQRLQNDAIDADAESRGITQPLFYNCKNTPESGVKANVTKVNYFGRWTNSVQARDGGSINSKFGIGYDSYRKQDKSVETRKANVDYGSGQLLPLTLTASASIDWSEDITTNTSGLTNNKSHNRRRVGLGATRNEIMTGGISHNVIAGAYYNDQRAVNQQQRNDSREGELNGALRSGAPVFDGVNVATRLYGIWRDGNSNLAGFESPSSTTGDSLGAGVYYKRRLMQGAVVATQSAFDRRYLAYRTNSNGLIDTMNVPPGVSKVVQELEEKDALDLRWDNTLDVGSLSFVSKLSHVTSRQQYRESAVGRRDNSEDNVDLRLTVPVGADSFAVQYKYKLKWDDQRFADAESNRGRQNQKVREFSIDWFRDLFSHTTISARYRTELSQDIAEVIDGDPYNENDRDRLTEEARIKLEADWTGMFRVSLLGEYQAIDDIAIRGTRSANNNTKRTYEIAPSYRWTVGPKLSVSQTFRMYIQYQDYDFADYPGVNKDDGFNKRGNLGTTISWKPSERLSVDVKHDYNQKFNGTRTSRDATGTAFYRRDQDQFINRIQLGLVWEASDWLKLEGATYRTKDVIKRYGTVDLEDTRYSGEMWLGGVIKHKWGPKDRPLELDATVKRYLAYGPNVTETSSDYWQADVLVKWTF